MLQKKQNANEVFSIRQFEVNKNWISFTRKLEGVFE